jgi:streptogramin lyase
MRVLAVTAGCLAICVALCAASAAAEPVGLIEEFDVDGYAFSLTPGPDGNVWFSFDDDLNRPGGSAIGRITPGGKVTMFRAGLNPRSDLGQVVVGPDGNLWFSNHGKRPAIGRITPQGAVTEFSAGLGPESKPGAIVAGPDGNIWFADGGKPRAIGRVTPSGEITEFSAGLDQASPPGGLVADPDGNIWFGAFGATIGRVTPAGSIAEFGDNPHPPPGTLGGPVVGPDGNLWIISGASRPVVARISPLGSIAELSAGLDPQYSLLGPIVPGPDGNLWFAARGQARRTGGKLPAFGDATAIGRITPSGEIATFNRCLHHGPPYTGPSSLVAGPDGNIWFTSTTTRSLPNVGTPPAIGRITPGGEITEFRAGLSYASTPDGIIVGPDGALWFTDRELGKIGRFAPSATPANTFLVGAAHRAKRNGRTSLSIIAPGPGVFILEQVGLISARNRLTRLAAGQVTEATGTAASCGRANPRLALKGLARKRLRRYGFITLKVKVSFTPDDGSPYSEYARVGVGLQRR